MADGASRNLSTRQLIRRIEATKPFFIEAVAKVKALTNALDANSTELRVDKVKTTLGKADKLAEGIMLARRNMLRENIPTDDVAVTQTMENTARENLTSFETQATKLFAHAEQGLKRKMEEKLQRK